MQSKHESWSRASLQQELVCHPVPISENQWNLLIQIASGCWSLIDGYGMLWLWSQTKSVLQATLQLRCRGVWWHLLSFSRPRQPFPFGPLWMCGGNKMKTYQSDQKDWEMVCRGWTRKNPRFGGSWLRSLKSVEICHGPPLATWARWCFLLVGVVDYLSNFVSNCHRTAMCQLIRFGGCRSKDLAEMPCQVPFATTFYCWPIMYECMFQPPARKKRM